MNQSILRTNTSEKGMNPSLFQTDMVGLACGKDHCYLVNVADIIITPGKKKSILTIKNLF